MNYPAGLRVLGYQQITVSTTAIGLTVPAKTIRAKIVVEAQPLRYRLDGTDPSSTVGTLALAGAEIEVFKKEVLAAFKAIRSGGTDSVISVHYFG